MNMFMHRGSKINSMNLAYDFVTRFSIDEVSAIDSLSSNLREMSEDEIRQWFDHMGELLADKETSTKTLLALLGALGDMDARN